MPIDLNGTDGIHLLTIHPPQFEHALPFHFLQRQDQISFLQLLHRNQKRKIKTQLNPVPLRRYQQPMLVKPVFLIEVFRFGGFHLNGNTRREGREGQQEEGNDPTHGKLQAIGGGLHWVDEPS